MNDPLGLVQSGGVGRMAPLAPKAPQGPGGPGGAGEAGEQTFKDVLMKNIEQVNALQRDAEMAIEDLVSGRRDDVDQVVMAKQKADLAFQMLLQVRNKLVDAYDEIRQMRV